MKLVVVRDIIIKKIIYKINDIMDRNNIYNKGVSIKI